MTAPRSVAFRVDWEPDPEELRAVALYLINQPEQGNWEWEDHCEGLAGGILQTLHVLAARRAGVDPARPPGRELTELERQRYIAQSRRLGQHVERLRAENDAVVEIIERIMTQHWDMAACPCWVCVAGRGAGCRPRDTYLKRDRPRVRVEP